METPPTFQGYNPNSQSVRRILREFREMQAETSTLFKAAPLEDNIFEWHFTIRGPRDTEFEGGVYHGRIILPAEYPYKPPDIVFLTPNGRFELDKKICLTISSHHEETWRPSWSIRTVLVALIAFMPTKGDGALASLDWPAEERKKLAKKSLGYKCEKCGAQCLTALPPEDTTETVSAKDVPEELQIRDAASARTATPASPLKEVAGSQSSSLSSSSTAPRPVLTQSAPANPISVPQTPSTPTQAASAVSPPQSPIVPPASPTFSPLAASSAAILQTAPIIERTEDKQWVFLFDVFISLVGMLLFALLMRRIAVGFPGLQ